MSGGPEDDTVRTAWGAPIDNARDSLTGMQSCCVVAAGTGLLVCASLREFFRAAAGPRGPLLMADGFYMDKMTHFNRERIPERVVHAKGSGTAVDSDIKQPHFRGLDSQFQTR